MCKYSINVLNYSQKGIQYIIYLFILDVILVTSFTSFLDLVFHSTINPQFNGLSGRFGTLPCLPSLLLVASLRLHTAVFTFTSEEPHHLSRRGHTGEREAPVCRESLAHHFLLLK
jgi:hypothetical protein